MVFLVNKVDILARQEEISEVSDFVADNAQRLLGVEAANVLPISARAALDAKLAAQQRPSQQRHLGRQVQQMEMHPPLDRQRTAQPQPRIPHSRPPGERARRTRPRRSGRVGMQQDLRRRRPAMEALPQLVPARNTQQQGRERRIQMLEGLRHRMTGGAVCMLRRQPLRLRMQRALQPRRQRKKMHCQRQMLPRRQRRTGWPRQLPRGSASWPASARHLLECRALHDDLPCVLLAAEL